VSVRAEVLQVGDSWVVAKSTSVRRQKPKGVIHFLGGAFAGAAPQVVYSLFLDLLAERGYTVVATPYAVTFRHLDAAASVRTQFETTLASLKAQGRDWLVPEGVPLLAVGHSMGSLLHALLGATQPGPAPAATVLISFNNKQVSDAIPIPGLMANLPTAMAAARALPLPPPPVPLPDAAAFLKGAMSLLPPAVAGVIDEGGRVSRAALALEQVASVVGEVEGGTTDFTPNPEETKALLAESYAGPRTLLVRFENDAIDETLQLEAALSSGRPGREGLLCQVLPGTHVTPCGGEIPYAAGPAFNPLAAAVQVAQYAGQLDVRRLADYVCDWLDAAVRVHAAGPAAAAGVTSSAGAAAAGDASSSGGGSSSS